MRHAVAPVLVIGLTLATLAVRARGQPAEGADDRPPVEQVEADEELPALVEQLAKGSANSRREAMQELVKRGEAVVPQLRRLADASQNPETKAAIRSVLQAIAARNITVATLVSLDLKDAPLRTAMESLAQQVGSPLKVSPDTLWDDLGPVTVTLRVDDQPFWIVMRDLLLKHGLSVMDMGLNNGSLRIARGSPTMGGPYHQSGPFLVVATGVTRTTEFRYDPADKRVPGRTTISLRVHVEPKLRLVGYDMQPGVEEFVDDGGHSLIAPPPDPKHRFPTPRAPGIVFGHMIPVADVEGRTKRVTKLKGSIRGYALTAAEALEVGDLLNAKGSTHRNAGWRVTVSDVVSQGPTTTIKVSAEREDPPPAARGDDPDAPWRPAFHTSDLRVLDADGGELRTVGSNWGSGDGRWHMELRLAPAAAGGGPPAKLVWNVPVAWKEVRIPFEFTDLELP